MEKVFSSATHTAAMPRNHNNSKPMKLSESSPQIYLKSHDLARATRYYFEDRIDPLESGTKPGSTAENAITHETVPVSPGLSSQINSMLKPPVFSSKTHTVDFSLPVENAKSSQTWLKERGNLRSIMYLTTEDSSTEPDGNKGTAENSMTQKKGRITPKLMGQINTGPEKLKDQAKKKAETKTEELRGEKRKRDKEIPVERAILGQRKEDSQGILGPYKGLKSPWHDPASDSPSSVPDAIYSLEDYEIAEANYTQDQFLAHSNTPLNVADAAKALEYDLPDAGAYAQQQYFDEESRHSAIGSTAQPSQAVNPAIQNSNAISPLGEAMIAPSPHRKPNASVLSYPEDSQAFNFRSLEPQPSDSDPEFARDQSLEAAPSPLQKPNESFSVDQRNSNEFGFESPAQAPQLNQDQPQSTENYSWAAVENNYDRWMREALDRMI